VASWMAREGLDWGLDQLAAEMQALRRMSFVPAEVSAYLDEREQEVSRRCEILRPALYSMRSLAAANSHG
jgi:hypothetical protein